MLCVCGSDGIVNRLVNEALPGSDSSSLTIAHDKNCANDLELLNALQKSGFVRNIYQTSTHSAWQLTIASMSTLEVQVSLHKPRPVFHPRSDVDLADCTTMELILRLDDAQWRHSMLLKPKLYARIASGMGMKKKIKRPAVLRYTYYICDS